MTTRGRHRLVGLEALGLLGVLLLGGCGLSDGSQPRPVDSDIAALLSPSASPTQEAGAPLTATQVTWVQGDRLVQRLRLLPADTRQEQLDGALNALVNGGLRPTEVAAGLESRLPPGLPVMGTVRGSRVALELTSESQTEPGGIELAVGQLATTALSIPGVRSVVFTVDGDRTAVPVPDGRPRTVLRMSDYRSVLRG